METMKCPNCGTTLIKQSLGVGYVGESLEKDDVVCPICHQTAHSPQTKQVGLDAPSRVLNFTVGQSAFSRYVIDALIETDYTPIDVFSTVSMGKMYRAYVPMHRFEGSYSAQYSYKVQREVIGVDGKKRKEYQPDENAAQGKFVIMLCAHEGNDIPVEMVSFVESLPDPVVSDSAMSPNTSFADNTYIFASTVNDAHVWKKRGYDQLKSIVNARVKSELKGEKVKGVKTTFNFSYVQEPELVMVPIWFTYYYYQSRKYYFLMDGTSEGNHIQTIPEDKTAIRTLRRSYQLEWLLGIGAVVAAPLFTWMLQKLFGASLLGSYITWIVFLVLWAYCAWRIFMAHRRLRRGLDEAKALRRAAAQRFTNRPSLEAK